MTLAVDRAVKPQHKQNCNDPKYSDRPVWTNNVDPDQTAPEVVV